MANVAAKKTRARRWKVPDEAFRLYGELVEAEQAVQREIDLFVEAKQKELNAAREKRRFYLRGLAGALEVPSDAEFLEDIGEFRELGT